MKLIALAAVAAILVLPAASFAQAKAGTTKSGQTKPGTTQQNRQGGDFQKQMAARRKAQRDRMIKELKLTADQIKKMDALDKTTQAKQTKLMGTTRPANGQRPDQKQMDAMRKSFEKIRTEHTAGMKKILKADQFAKYQKMLAERRRPGGAAGPSSARRGAGGAKA